MESSSASVKDKAVQNHSNFEVHSWEEYIDSEYKLPLYLCQCALDDFNWRELGRTQSSLVENLDKFYENVNVVKTVKLPIGNPPTTCLLITFEAYLPADKTTQTFETEVKFRSRRTAKIKIVFVRIKGQDDSQELRNLPCELIDNLSDSEDYDEDERCPLNPAFLKKRPLDDIPKKDPEGGPTYRPSPFLRLMRQCTRKYEEGSALNKEIKSFKMDVEKSGGFEVGHYPLMDQAQIRGTWIFKYYDIENKLIPAVYLSKLVHFSQLALCVYNMKEDTRFSNVKVLKTMTYGFGGPYGYGGPAYNITFKASLSDKDAEIFQTNICTSVGLPITKLKVTFVRIKPN